MFQGEEQSYFLFHSMPLLAETPELKRRKMKEKNERQRWGIVRSSGEKAKPHPWAWKEARAQTEQKPSQMGKGWERRRRGGLSLHQGGSRSI